MAKILLIGVTGGTGRRAAQGFLEQSDAPVRVLTRNADRSRPEIAWLAQAGVELVEGDLDQVDSLAAALAGVTQVYCHATAGDYSQADPAELERAQRLAQAAEASTLEHWIYNSSGGAERNSGIRHIEQKHQVEQIFQAAGLPLTNLRACLFMEEFWKKYTRPGILKGKFRFSVQPDRPLHLLSAQDLGRVAATILGRSDYVGRSIELASDVLNPTQMAEAFSQVQGRPVKHQELPAWLFLLLGRKSLFDLIQWYRQAGYEADVEQLRAEFPGLLTPFEQFLQATDWANPELSYGDWGLTLPQRASRQPKS